jgi:hypothetical protein
MELRLIVEATAAWTGNGNPMSVANEAGRPACRAASTSCSTAGTCRGCSV